MKDWKGRVVWITGASSGIGRGLAIRLAQAGAWVFASARNEAALRELKRDYDIEPCACDVTDRESVLRAAVRIEEQAGGVDLLVANAGTCEYLDVQAFDSALVERVFATNFFGFVHTVEAALPLLRASEVRHIAGVGSSAAYTGLPRAEAYGASKAAMHYFLDSLRVDLTGEGFTVSTIAPGFVATPLTDRNDFGMPMRISVDEAVDYIVAGLEHRHADISFPPAFSNALKAMRLLPTGLRNRLYQRLVRKS